MPATPKKAFACPTTVGRAHEIAVLQSLLESAQLGHGQVALVSGDAGIGKSRLVAEVKAQANARGFITLQGNCFLGDAFYPYAPLLDLLRAFSADRSSPTRAAEQDALLQELVGLLPDLAFLVSASVPTQLTNTITSTEQKHRLSTLLTQLLIDQAAMHPLLVILEDLHWCDESTLDLLLRLAHHTRTQPVLCLFTYRSDELSPGLRHWLAQLDHARLAQELALAPLTHGEVSTMLQAIFTAPDSAPAEVLDLIYARSEGYPFYVEELLTAMGVVHNGGIWQREAVSGAAHHLSDLPRSIQDAVQQRTEGLSLAASHVLILAAVAGRRFDFALLQQVLQCDEGHLLALIKELMAAQLVVEEAEDQFLFRHALIREAVYAGLLVRERRALHRAIGEAIETLSASESVRMGFLTALAYHFSAAGIWPKALEYEQRAGDKALSLYAPRAADGHFTRALDAADHLRLTSRAKLFFARGQASAMLDDFERARGDYERVVALARNEHDGVLEWQSMLALGLLWAARDYAEAGAWFQRACALAEKLADPSLRARSLNRLGNWLANTGRPEEGLRANQDALTLFEGTLDKQGMAETYDFLGAAYGIIGDQVNAAHHLGHAIALFRELGDRQSLMSSLAMRAIQSCPLASITSCCAMRSRDECVADAEESLRLAREIESPSGQAFAEMALARTLASFGELGHALHHAHEIARAASAVEHRQWLVASAASTGNIYYQLLAPAEARAALEAGLKLARELGSTNWIALLTAYLALADTAVHNLTAAEEVLSAVLPRDQVPRNNAERLVARATGELALAQGAPEIALELAEHLLATAPGKDADQHVQLIPHLLKLKGESLMALTRLDEAAEALEGAKRGALIREEPSVLWTIHRSLARLYRLLHREEDVRKEVAAAQRYIEELGATLDDADMCERFIQGALSSLPQAKALSPREVTKRAFGGLTARERQVAALVAQGKKSREIAARLVVSDRTAEVHVSNILGKLGFSSRAQIAVWAVDKGLTGE